jgi:hypothetical protein
MRVESRLALAMVIFVPAGGTLVGTDERPYCSLAGTISRVDTASSDVKLLVDRSDRADARAYRYVRTRGGDAPVQVKSPGGAMSPGELSDLLPGGPHCREQRTVSSCEAAYRSTSRPG